MAVAPESFLVLEASLYDRLQKNWDAIKARIVASMLLRFKEDDHTALEKLVAQIKLERAIEGDHAFVNLMGSQAMFFGVSRVVPPMESKTLKSKKVGGFTKKVTKHTNMILTDMSRTVRRKVRQLLADEFDARTSIVKAEILKPFVSALDAAVAASGSLQLAASLHTSRLAVLGHMVESIAHGRKTTVWNAILDSRTCPVCAHLADRVFSVEIIMERTMKVLAAETVEDLKRLAPWASQSKDNLVAFKKMTTMELHNAGYDSPPAHPLCRCFLDVTETPIEEVEGITTELEGRVLDLGLAAMPPEVIDPATRSAGGLIIPQEDVE